MPRCFSLAALAAVLLAAPASAQITFTADDYFALIGPSTTTTTVSTGVNEEVSAADRQTIQDLIAQTGANQTWDFTTLTYVETSEAENETFEAGDVAGLPGASNFPSANTATVARGTFDGESFESYAFFRLEANGDLYSVGSYDADQDVPVSYTPNGLRTITFPLTFGTATSGSATVESPAYVGTTALANAETEVVGYGTLVTPEGSFDALMVRFDFEITATVSGFSYAVNQDVTAWITAEGVSADAFYREQSDGMGGTAIAVEASYTFAGSSTSNSAPTVNGTVTASATAGETTPIDVLASVTDADGDALSITGVTDPAHGTAEVGDGSGRRIADVVLYTPDAGFTGEDAFDFTVSDGTAEATGSVTVTVTGGTAAESGPDALVLAVVPNPSSGLARVALTTARADDATVTVWDAVGREVARLHDGPLSAGVHTFALDAAALAPGVYLARVALGGTVTTARLTIAR